MLKQIFLNIYSQIGIKSARTKNIARHVGWSFLYKAGSIIGGFLLVPLTIDYLGTENYGVWLTLSSFIIWFSFFDIGLGNGLRNKFAEAKALEDYSTAQAYVSTAYYTIGLISLILVLLFFFVNHFIDWTIFFNTSSALAQELSLLLPVIFAFFGLHLVVKLITTIYQADQHHSIQGKVQFYIQTFSLLIIWLLTKTGQSSLLIFGTIFSALPVIVLLGLNVFAFRKKYKKFRPRFSQWKRKHLNEITGLGFKFFIVQMASIVLFSTDNFIISKLFGPEEVVPYNIAFKYFSLVTMAFTIIITPYWSSFTEAFTKKEFDWIRRSVINVQKLWLLVPVVLVIMVLLADWFYYIWVGEQVIVPLLLNVSMATFVTFFTFSMIYNNFINGVGKIRLHFIISIVIMLLNVPLSIFFARNLEMGVSGIIIASSVCIALNILFMPIQYYKLINNKATGIWNK